MGVNIIYISIGTIVPNRTEDIGPPISLSRKTPPIEYNTDKSRISQLIKINIVYSAFNALPNEIREVLS